MGSEIYVAMDTPGRGGRERLERVPAMFEAWEQRLSRFRADSELSRLNRQSGRAVGVSDALWQVLALARRAEQASGGLVTPAVLTALEAAGYERSFEPVRDAAERAPAPAAVQAAADRRSGPIDARSARAEWRLDERKRTVWLSPGLRLDLGGVAKGWAAEQTAAYLGELAPALVDAGGDIVVTAPRADGEPWAIGIENPLGGADDDLPVLLLARGGVATSGRDYRKWVRNHQSQHHLIDPRSGTPAVTDVLTATIIAATVSEAEVAAKVAFILGSAAGREWIEARPHLAALLVLEDGRVVTSTRIDRYMA